LSGRLASGRNRARWAAALAAISLLVLAAPAETTPAPPLSPPSTPAQKDALAAVDRGLVRFAALLARDDNARHRAEAQTVLDGLKRRRDALRAAFDPSKCDDLRAELILEYQRLAAWVGSPRSAPAAAGAGSVPLG
jgi:hypothetical protein